MKKVLIIDGDRDTCVMLSRFLEKNGYMCSFVLSGLQALRAIKKDHYDIVVADDLLADINNAEFIKKIQSLISYPAAIVITSRSPEIRNAVESIRLGAVDYLAKPLIPDNLLIAISGINTHANHAPKQQSVKNENGHTFLVGNSQYAKKIYGDIEIIAPTDMAVVISGETGTGKEFVAREIHRQSKRSLLPFVAIDCGALTETLANSEFFGHEKGAFTDAASNKDGSFKTADGGTLFLDEIGNLSYDTQAKLLRALQEKKIKRVGGVQDIDIDVRIIVATNEDLKDAIKAGHFREDLYHRLNEFGIRVPPLRQRTEDIPGFANHFLEHANVEFHKSISRIDDNALEVFLNYNWPGNLRELRNVIRRAALLCHNGVITTNHLPYEILFARPSTSQGNEPDDLRQLTMAAEKQAIETALTKTKNNKSVAARLLKIDRKTLYNKMKALNIKH